MKIKNIVTLLFAVVVGVTFAGCGKSNNNNGNITPTDDFQIIQNTINGILTAENYKLNDNAIQTQSVDDSLEKFETNDENLPFNAHDRKRDMEAIVWVISNLMVNEIGKTILEKVYTISLTGGLFDNYINEINVGHTIIFDMKGIHSGNVYYTFTVDNNNDLITPLSVIMRYNSPIDYTYEIIFIMEYTDYCYMSYNKKTDTFIYQKYYTVSTKEIWVENDDIMGGGSWEMIDITPFYEGVFVKVVGNDIYSTPNDKTKEFGEEVRGAIYEKCNLHGYDFDTNDFYKNLNTKTKLFDIKKPIETVTKLLSAY